MKITERSLAQRPRRRTLVAGVLAALAMASLASAQNDDCAGALELLAGVPQSFDTTVATLDTQSAPAWSCSLGAPDIWFRYTPSSTGLYVRFETCGSAYDTAIELFEGDCGNPVAVGCADNGCALLQSRLDYVVTSQAPLLLRVGGYSTSVGVGTVVVREFEPDVVAILDTVPGSFMDISATGTALGLDDNDEVDIMTTVGNDLFPAGVVRVGANGGLRFSGISNQLTPLNQVLPSFGAFTQGRALLPYWDDFHMAGGLEGDIYWQEFSDRLVIQWDTAEFFPGGTQGDDSATFQVQIFASGLYDAQILYEDVEGWSADGGASATIGFQSENPTRLTTNMFSFDTPGAISDGDVLTLRRQPGGIGTPYCGGTPNVSGDIGVLSAIGSLRAQDNDVILRASKLPPNVFGFFIASMDQGFIANPGGSQGDLCVGGPIGRYVGPGEIMNTFSTRELRLRIDLSAVPQPTGFVGTSAGTEWNFQAWYRDGTPVGPSSNFTRALSVRFQ